MNKLRFYSRLLRLLAVLALGLAMAGWVSLLERFRRNELMALRQRLTRRFLAQLAAALPFRLSLHGQLPERPMLWVGNHVSWTDIPLLGGLVPLSFLSKSEVRSWPLAGWLAHKAGTLFIRRGAGDSGLVRGQLLRHLQHGHDLLIFPEGTRVPVGQIDKFSRGGAALAANAGLPVLPVAHDAGLYWPKEGWGKTPGTVRVVFGPPLQAEGEGPRAIADLNERAFAWVAQTQRQLGVLADEPVVDGPAKV
ncbi:lysophospholipid acyltransferase family protein [Azotobacter chroococcum]|nr:lysophospholipid acyltransferase family protein [Azotobacter chroococcum]